MYNKAHIILIKTIPHKELQFKGVNEAEWNSGWKLYSQPPYWCK